MVAAGFSLRSRRKMNNKIIQKKHRLDPDLYKGQKRVTFTVCVEDKYPIFKTETVIDVFFGYFYRSA